MTRKRTIKRAAVSVSENKRAAMRQAILKAIRARQARDCRECDTPGLPRKGFHFDHELRCPNCGHIWNPDED